MTKLNLITAGVYIAVFAITMIIITLLHVLGVNRNLAIVIGTVITAGGARVFFRYHRRYRKG